MNCLSKAMRCHSLHYEFQRDWFGSFGRMFDDEAPVVLLKLLCHVLEQLREGKSQQGQGLPACYSVNQRAQSGLALMHILCALGYDWGIQMLIPLGATLNLQVLPHLHATLQLCFVDAVLL
jgi:hypothetical protein